MFFVLSKLLYLAFMPLSWIVWVLFAVLFIKNPVRKRQLVQFSIILILLLGNGFIINELLIWYEIPPVKIEKKYGVGIVLTGGIAIVSQEPFRHQYFSNTADRALQAILAYKKGSITKILVTGGETNTGLLRNVSEAEAIQDFMIQLGVLPQDIIIENQSKNTHENAIFSVKILEKSFPQQHYLLFTSAFHQRRSVACFQKEGIAVTAFPTDFLQKDRHYVFEDFYPKENALKLWYALVHEWVGYGVYAVMGYV